MAFHICTTRNFVASHRLRLYDGSLEPLHQHNWLVGVTVSAAQLDRIGVVMDFHYLQRLLDQVIGPWNNQSLNDVPALAALNPSTENVAFCIARELEFPKGIKLLSVQVWETSDSSATWLTD